MDKALVFLERLKAVVATAEGDHLTIMEAVGCLEVVKKELLEQLEYDD